MSKYLERAREALGGPTRSRDWYSIANLILLHLEAQEAATPSPTTASPSETPSSAATPTQAGTKPTWSTSYTLSCPVRVDGSLSPLALPDIWDWLNSRQILGNVQAVEIGVTLTSKAATSPSGSASPSTPPPPESVIGSSSRSGAPGAAAAESPSRAGRDAPSPTGSSEKLCWHCGERTRAHNQILCHGCLDDSVVEMHRSGIEALTAPWSGAGIPNDYKPAPRPQWPEPKPGEDAWSVTWRGSGLTYPIFHTPGGYEFDLAQVRDYLNALWNGLSPRDRWPS